MAKRTFEEWYEDFLKYNQNGSVPGGFVTPEGNKLGTWIQRVRAGDTKLTSEQKQMLKNVNFVWTIKGKYRRFDEWLWDFLKYTQNGYVPRDFITPEGNRLGIWIHNIRSGQLKLTAEQKQMLDDADFVWSVRKGRRHKYN